jgi:2-oxoglutarate dehydrogenase E1 component
LSRYRKAKEWVWVQEESMNMGGWTFMEPQLRALGWTVAYVGRDSSASPATGSRRVHLQEQKDLVKAAIGEPVPHLVRAASDGRGSAEGDGGLIKEEAKAAVPAG